MRKLTNAEFLKRLEENKGGRFIALDTYISHKHKMKFKHLPCGNEFYAITNTILNKRSEGCPFCGARDRVVHRTKTLDTLIKEVNDLYPNKFYIYTDQIIKNNKTKIKVKCNNCGNDFMISPSNLLRDRGCPMCCKTIANQSKNSDRIRDYLLDHGYILKNIIDKSEEKYFIKEKSFDDLYADKPLRFDYALYNKDTLKCLIEYDGEFHFRQVDKNALKQVQEHDKIKDKYCKDHNITLIRFNYKTFKVNNYIQLLDNMFNVLKLNE